MQTALRHRRALRNGRRIADGRIQTRDETAAEGGDARERVSFAAVAAHVHSSAVVDVRAARTWIEFPIFVTAVRDSRLKLLQRYVSGTRTGAEWIRAAGIERRGITLVARADFE